MRANDETPTGRRPMSARRRWVFRLAAMSGATVLAFLIGEITVRIIVGTPLPERLPLMQIDPHPTRAWAMTPDSEHYTYIHPVRVNRLGLRDDEVGPKPADERRIIALGDSLVYGQGVPDDATLPAQLEQRLNTDAAPGHTTVRVINAGVRGYSTVQELELLKEIAPAVEPDVVVLFWYWNDLKETEVRDGYLILKASGPVPFDTLAPIDGWRAKTKWHTSQLIRRSALVMYLHDLFAVARAPSPPRGLVEKGYRLFDRHAARFVAMSKRHGFQPVVAIIPDANPLYRDHPSESYSDRIETIAKEHGLPVVRLTPALRAFYERTGDLPVVPFDGHYNGKANEVISNVVADKLKALTPSAKEPTPQGRIHPANQTRSRARTRRAFHVAG